MDAAGVHVFTQIFGARGQGSGGVGALGLRF